MKDRALDYYSVRVWIDLLLMLVVLVLSVVVPLPANVTPDQEGAFFSFLTAIVSFTSIVVAVAVFACSMVYQSSANGLKQVRRLYSEELRNNWSSVLAWSFLAGAASVVGVGVAAAGNHAVGLILAINAGAWALIKGTRGLVWFVSALFLIEEDDVMSNFPDEISLRSRDED